MSEYEHKHVHSDNCCHAEHGNHEGCGCEHCHKAENLGLTEHEHVEKTEVSEIVFTVVSLILLVLGLLPVFSEPIKKIFLIASAVASGYRLIPDAVSELKRKKLDENFLVLIAVVAAFCIGEGAEAAFVSLFFRIGEAIEDYSVERSKKAIKKLYEITSDKAVIFEDETSTREIDSHDIKVGDILLVSPFEKIPVDCECISDGGTVDTSAITGESIPTELHAGMSVLSGSINGPSAVKLRAVSVFEDSAASRIIKSVEESGENKGGTDKFITRFAEIYTPAVVGLAIVLAVIPSLVTGNWTVYIHRALVFLVAACPCALVLSIPLGFFASIGAQSKHGIVVKGGKFIEKLASADAVLLDKTGTLTDNDFEIREVFAADGFTREKVIEIAAYAEKYSTHPLAAAFSKEVPDIDESRISDFKEHSGNGTEILLDGKKVLCGSRNFLFRNGVYAETDFPAQLYVTFDGKFVGTVSLSGKVREQSPQAVEELGKLGIDRIVMLTGDNEEQAKRIAEKCSIKEYKAGLLPAQKTEYLKALQDEGHTVIFAGDGINDTPTLSQADVGMAVGSGTAAAIEVGDAVLMNSNPANIAKAIKLSRRAMKVIKANIWFALGVKAAVLILGALGFAPMWAAVFADVGVCVIDVLNSTRLLLDKK
ncbi:MAG: cadmium-translocating P-type ATPase [Ruminococcaceae bacterium]|nr:cadmium-translocating P-type ATPase [Oscillospiraceae bacterium]